MSPTSTNPGGLTMVQQARAASAAAVTILTTTEKAGVILPGVEVGPGVDGFLLTGYVLLTTGAGTTSLRLHIRKGQTIAGAIVGEDNNRLILVAAGDTS